MARAFERDARQMDEVGELCDSPERRAIFDIQFRRSGALPGTPDGERKVAWKRRQKTVRQL